MLVGSVLGVLFVSLIRRAMVEDPELPFPESVAASRFTRPGRRGAKAAKYLFYNMGSARWFPGRQFNIFAPDRDFFFRVGQLGKSTLRLGPLGTQAGAGHRRRLHLRRAHRQPGLYRRGIHHRAGTGALNFSGSVVAWGLLIPLLIYLPGTAIAGLSAGRRHRRELARPGQQPSGVSSCGRLPWAA
jgi:hypothetical protein